MTERVDEILQAFQAENGGRGNWMDHWQRCAEVYLPGRADFTIGHAEGTRRTEKIFDSTPMIARRGLSSAVNGLLKPKTSQWMQVLPVDPDLEDNEEVREWTDQVQQRMWRAIYNPRAKFVQASAEVDDDLVTFGTGVLLIREARSLDRLLFRSVHLKNAVLRQNSEGDIDTIFAVMMWTPRQAAQQFGKENLGKETQDLLDRAPESKATEKQTFLRVIMPRDDVPGNGGLQPAPDMEFASIDIDVLSEHEIPPPNGQRLEGFHEFPYATPRWDTRSEELYGRSPAMLALSDSLTLQQQDKIILRAGQKIVDPPLLLPDDGVMSAIRTRPGGNTFIDMQTIRDFNGKMPVQPLQTGANIPIGLEMQQDRRDMIMQAFFRNVLSLPDEPGNMTATEVLERRQEFLQSVGPVFDRLEPEYPAVITRRVFRIMDRAGQFPPRPEVLREKGVRFEFESPVSRARKQLEMANLNRAFESMAPLAEAQPEMLDHFDGDEIVRDSPDSFGLPQRWLKSQDRVDELRESRAQAQAAAEQVELLERGAGIAETVSKAAATGVE